MNVWKLTAARTLVKTTEDAVWEENKRRIRVTKVFVNNDDALIFSGARRVNYPRIPGRFAVGVIADDKEGRYKKGTRVLLHTILPEENNETQKLDFTKTSRRICGQTTDGFLRDFVFADESDFTVLPDAVNDDKALLIQYVALAKAAVESLNPEKGDHVAVIGGDMLGLFICQLLIYRQVSPVLIDSHAERLEFARTCGIYYTFEIDDRLMEEIGNVTGGRLCDGVVVSTGAESNGISPFAACASDKNVVFCGQNGNNLTFGLNEMLEKQLSVHGISDGTDYIETAINLIANKAVDLNAFRANTIVADLLPAFFKQYAGDEKIPVNELNVVNML